MLPRAGGHRPGAGYRWVPTPGADVSEEIAAA